MGLAGCASKLPPADLVIINGAEPESLDPAIITGQPDLRAAGAIFEGLVRNDPRTGRPIPGLAERWEISPDGKIYTFHLRAGATWSTGEPFTAHDVVYSWRRVLHPETASDYAGQLFAIKNAARFNRGDLANPEELGIRALDPAMLRVDLEGPTVFFLDICTLPALAVVPRRVIEAHGARWLMVRPLPVSGPYELVEWRLNDRIRLHRNPRYWDAANTAIEWVDLLPVGSSITALNLYETGQADIVWDKDLIPTELLDLLLERPDFHTFDNLGTYFIRINVTRKPFDDSRVRQALALSVDKKRIVQRITRAGEKIAPHLTPYGIPNYDPPEGLGYDPARAQRLLAEAGYPAGQGFPRITYLFNAAAGGSSKAHQKIAVELRQMWQENLGIELELRQIEWKALLAAQSALDYDVCRSSWVGDYNDPNTFLDLFISQSGNNRTGWKNAEYDQLLGEANRQTDPAQRARLLRQAEKMLVEEAVPFIPLYFYTGINYYDPRKIEGIYPNIIDVHPINAIRWRKVAAGEPGPKAVQAGKGRP